MGTLSRDALFVIGALAAHGLFIGVSSLMPEPSYTFAIEKPMDLVELDVESLPTQKEEPTKETVDEPGSLDRRREERPDTPDSPRIARGERPLDPANPNPVEPPSGPTSDGPPPDDYDAPPNAQKSWGMIPGAPGGKRVWQVGGLVPDVGPAAPASTEAPAQQKVSRDKVNEVLGADLREKDKKLGLIPPGAGLVASTAKGAVRAGDLPDESRATLIVVIGPGGKIKSVKANSISGGTGGAWDAVAANVKASLAGQSLKFASDYDKGAIVVISVQSKRQMPSGGTPGSPVTLGQQKGGGLGGGFDLGDIGAKPVRVVYSSVVSVTPVK